MADAPQQEPSSLVRTDAWHHVTRVVVHGGLITAPLSVACILWFDLPISIWIHANGLDQQLWMRWLLSTPIALAPAAAVYLLVYALRRANKRAGIHEQVGFIISSTLLVSLQVKEMLKLAFGRTWPRNVVNPSPTASLTSCDSGPLGYINDGYHAFHAFGGSTKAFQAFPSGSTVALVAIALPLAMLYPRFRVALAAFVSISLLAYIITNTHFVGDVLVGAYVGAVAGSIALALIPRAN